MQTVQATPAPMLLGPLVPLRRHDEEPPPEDSAAMLPILDSSGISSHDLDIDVLAGAVAGDYDLEPLAGPEFDESLELPLFSGISLREVGVEGQSRLCAAVAPPAPPAEPVVTTPGPPGRSWLPLVLTAVVTIFVGTMFMI